MDVTHPHHNSVVACGWIKKGHEFELRSNTGRQRLNINGVSISTGKSHPTTPNTAISQMRFG